MPPNAKGGKKYKKSKHSSENQAVKFIEKEPDQMYARVLRLLGGNNISAYCNDDVQRVCHIRGSMRNRVWLNTGDMILISLREEMSGDKGDVIMKYDNSLMGKLKKLDDINPRLFMSMENGDGVKLNDIQDGDIFEHEVLEEGEELNESDIDAI